jgi:hypothetical protein
MKAILKQLHCFWKADTFSPEAFFLRAAILAALYALSRVIGLQEYTTFLSGTSPDVNLSWRTASTLGLVHLALHCAFILLVPIFLITAVLLAAWNHWHPEREIPVRESAGDRGDRD